MRTSDENIKFLRDSEKVAFDKEHRRKIFFNISQYDKAVKKGKDKYSNHELARDRAGFIKYKILNDLDRYLIEFEDNFIPTSGFFAEIMYPLLEKYSIEEIKEKIEFKNMSRFTKGLLNDVTRSCIEMLKREKKDVKEQVIDLLEQQKKSENKM